MMVVVVEKPVWYPEHYRSRCGPRLCIPVARQHTIVERRKRSLAKVGPLPLKVEAKNCSTLGNPPLPG